LGVGTDSGTRARRRARNESVWRLGPELAVQAPAGSLLTQAINEVFGLFAAPGYLEEERRIALDVRGGDRGALRLYVDRAPVMRVPSEEALAPALEAMLVGLAVRSRRSCAALHASSVELDGKGVMMLAEKGSGKSTLSYQLTLDGATYLGDEIAFVRFLDRRLEAFPKSVTIKRGAFDLFPRSRVHTDPIRGPVRYLRPQNVPADAEYSTNIDLLILPRWTEQADAVHLVELSPGETALELVRQSFGGLDRDPRTIALIAQLARVPAFRMIYADTAAASMAIRHLIHRFDS
jgi:hypothetical protein